jgi:hypothetical protein
VLTTRPSAHCNQVWLVVAGQSGQRSGVTHDTALAGERSWRNEAGARRHGERYCIECVVVREFAGECGGGSLPHRSRAAHKGGLLLRGQDMCPPVCRSGVIFVDSVRLERAQGGQLRAHQPLAVPPQSPCLGLLLGPAICVSEAPSRTNVQSARWGRYGSRWRQVATELPSGSAPESGLPPTAALGVGFLLTRPSGRIFRQASASLVWAALVLASSRGHAAAREHARRLLTAPPTADAAPRRQLLH